MQIKGIIFDLDDTLFDCTGQLTAPARRRAADVLAQAGLDPDALCRAQADLAPAYGSSGAIRELGRRRELPPGLVEQALAAYNTETVEAITLFPDAHDALCELARRRYALAIVTSGAPGRQREKIRKLGLSARFNEIAGTLVLHDDRRTPDKTPGLERAARNMNLPCCAVLSVGDKLDAEIAASNRLGMTTVRMRHGRQKNRAPRHADERPNFEINTLAELLALLP